MAIFGNFKGTTQSEFQIGKSTNGTKISTGTQPSSNLSTGDLWLNSANSTIEVYSSGEWKSIGSTLKELNVDSGTLFVDSSNDTVSIGSTSSNDKLFVNGSLRLGTNPSLKHSGAYLDVSHTNGSATQLRVRDNSSSGSDPIFKVYNANNTSEVFKVQGTTIRINDAYDMPTADGTANQILQTDGSGTLSFVDNNASATPGGANTQIQFNDDGAFGGHANLTFDSSTETFRSPSISVDTFTYSVLSEDYGTIGESVTVTKDYGDLTTAEDPALKNVVEDTTPQLGGNLELNSNSITGTGNIDITGTATFSGNVTLEGFTGNENEVVVVGSGGTLSSTDNLTIDVANSRVGIGTASPATKFHIAGEGANEGQIRLQQANDGGDGPDFAFYTSRGTIASPTSTADNDVQGRINAYVHNGTNFVQSGSFGWSSDGTDGDNTFDIRSRVGGTLAKRIEVVASGDIEFQDGAFDVDVKSHDGTNGLKLGGTLVTSSATELNLLDGVTGITLGSANELLVVGTDGSSVVSDSTLAVDTVNNRLGINQTSPEVTLHMTGEAAQSAQIRMEQMADTGDAPDIRTRKSRGTAAAPTKNNAGDFIYRQNHERYNGTGWTTVGQLAVDTDGTNADRFKMTFAVSEDGGSIDAAQNQLMIDGADSGAITFNQAYKFPTADGSSGQVLTTNGSGTLTFANIPTVDIVDDTTPQLGGDLDAQNNNIDNVGVATAKSYKDTVFTITDGASVDIDPDNGGIQVWTLGANRSPTANNFDAGAKVMLMINDGSSYSITWPSVNWVGGVAPTLPTSGYGIVELWKVGSQLYGAFAGGVA
jgi:hypothetical protein